MGDSDYITRADELGAIEEFVKNQKNKLPIQVDAYTVWTDIEFNNNKIIYIYKISSDEISEQQIKAMKNYYYSDPKKSEICENINNLLAMKIVYVYKYINMKNKELVVIPFDEEMCLK